MTTQQLQKNVAANLLVIALSACGDRPTESEPPNRPPMVAGEIPARSIAAGGSAILDASEYFSDPDGDALTYLAVSGDSSVVRVYTSGAEILMFAKNRGKPWPDTAAVTVTATDPGGLSAEQHMVVMVEAGDVGFRDDFDSEVVSRWQVTNATAEIDAGTLLLTGLSSAPGIADRELNAGMVDWEVRAHLSRVQDSLTVRIVASTGHPVIKAFALDIGPGVLVDGNTTDYRLLWLDDRSGWEVMGSGSAASLRNLGTAVEVGLFLKDGQVGATIAGNPAHTESAPAYDLTAVGLWVVPQQQATGRQALFEWIEVAGTVN